MANDVSYIVGILATMTIIAFFIPYAEAEFIPAVVTQPSTHNWTTLSTPIGGTLIDLSNETVIYQNVGIGNILGSMGKMIFLTYDWFPLWLIMLHIIIRVIVVFLFYRAIRSGAG